jgi:ureidoglycolate lyase
VTDTLEILPLTKSAFAPYGDVIEADASTVRLINGGTTERFHALSKPQVIGAPVPLIINIFRSQPRQFPYQVTMMERHPFASQSFSPMSGQPFLIAVSDDEADRPSKPLVFLAQPHQGVNYFANVWHHPLMAIGKVSDFLVVDRDDTAANYEEVFFETPYLIGEPKP